MHTNLHMLLLSTQIHRDTVPYFPNTNTYGPFSSQPPSIKSTSCAGGWNRAGLESGRPNPSVRGGTGVCHPPLWAPSSWKRERGDRGWCSHVASGSARAPAAERWRGQEPRCSPGETLAFCSQKRSTEPIFCSEVGTGVTDTRS